MLPGETTMHRITPCRTPLFLMLVVLLWPAGIQASSAPSDVVSEAYTPYAELLKDFLVEKDLSGDGLVSAFDYEAALADEATNERLQRQRELLAAFDVDALESREKAIAFWLNAYNFFMIDHILEHRPDDKLIDSVWDYGGRINPLRSNVFERELFNIGGQKYSLDGIEKGILLGDQYKERDWFEARVHFAVNCASVGCPPLRQQIYTPDNVDRLMSENTRRAFNTPHHLKVDGDTLYLTRLFDWYEDHFEREAGSIREFIRAYADQAVVEDMQQTDTISHISYDWSLNKPANFDEFSQGASR